MRPPVTMMFHPTLAVADLEAARTWFTSLFRRPAVRWEERYDLSLLNPDYPTNYSFFINVADVVIDALSPSMHRTGSMSGQNRYRAVTEGMIGVGWYTDDVFAVAAALREAGIMAHDQFGAEVVDGMVPVSAMASDVLIAFTDARDAGYRYEFFELGQRHRPFYSQKGDPRLRADWALPAPSADDPLRIQRASHHTFLTTNLERAVHLYCDVLGGKVVDERVNAELGAASTFVEFAGSVLEYAVPGEASAYGEAAADVDFYSGITFLVEDVDAAHAYLDGFGVSPRRIAPDVVAIVPEHGFGAEWRFAAGVPYAKGS